MTAKMELGAWCGVWLRITGLVGQSGGANIRPNSSHVCVCVGTGKLFWMGVLL